MIHFIQKSVFTFNMPVKWSIDIDYDYQFLWLKQYLKI